MNPAGKGPGRYLRAILSSGLDRRSLARTLVVGVAMGVMPLLWGTSLLCVLVARRMKLNHAVLQGVNYLCYPLQWALLLPFCKLGLLLFPWGPAPAPGFFDSLLHGEIAGGVNPLMTLTFKALAAWLLAVILLALPAYHLLGMNCFRIFSPRRQAVEG